MSSKKKKPNAPSPSKIRIIGGQWRGRKLSIEEAEGLRPTGDRVRETLFNWLAADIPGARCLDAFAGSGALGFEALSRGAKFTQFIELQKEPVKNLRENIHLLDANAHAECANFTQWIPKNIEPFDIVFFDPPFADALWQQSITHLTSNIPLSQGSLVYIESPKEQQLAIPNTWELYKNKSAGQVNFTLYKTSYTKPS